MRVQLVDVVEQLEVAAWIPAQALSRPNWSGDATAADVRRIVLTQNDSSWPGPPRWPSWYAGVWAFGQLRLPPGAVMLSGPAWRKRPLRGPR